MSVTRNRSNRKRNQARSKAFRQEILGEEIGYDPNYRTVSHLPTTALMRHPGEFEHSGAEVAKMLATGAANMTFRNKDAAGPLKENVGCTVKTIDYIGGLPERHNGGAF